MQPQPPEVTIPIETVTQDQLEIEGSPALAAAIDSTMEVDGRISFIQKIPEAKLWEWMREQLIVRPGCCRPHDRDTSTGIHRQLADTQAIHPPRRHHRRLHAKNPASDKAKREAIAVLSRLGKHANAKTLNDLTIETLTAWRDEIERTVRVAAPRKRITAASRRSSDSASSLGWTPHKSTPPLTDARCFGPPRQNPKWTPSHQP